MPLHHFQPLGFVQRSRLGIAAIFCAACCGTASSHALAVRAEQQVTSVVIVRSKEVEPFRQAESAFVASLPSDINAQSWSLSEATPEALAKAAAQPATAFFAIGSEASERVKSSIGTGNPLTCAMVSDPAAIGVFSSRATTVVSMDCPHAAQVAFISSALPKVRRIGVLYHGGTAKGKRAVEGMRIALPQGWTLEAIAVEKEASISDAIARMFSSDIDLVWTYPDSSLYEVATIKSILLESLRKNVPVFGFSPAFVRAGAIIGVGTTPADQGRQAAAALQQE